MRARSGSRDLLLNDEGWATARAVSSFDHLVGAGEQGRRNSRPSALAVFRLITSSYLVGACTGRSAGFSPLRMRST